MWRHAASMPGVDDELRPRTIAPDGAGGSVVRDHVWFSPRIRRLDPLLARVVRRVFEHRHRRLERRFSARS